MKRVNSKMSYCSWCDKEFEATSSKQIYCSIECRQESSRKKITERNKAEKVKNRIGKQRLCGGGCGTVLSIYNDEGICDICIEHKKKMNKFMKELKGYFDYSKK